MIPATVCALALFAINPQPPGNQNPTTRGSEESTSRYHGGGGMTLEALHGLPMIRPTWTPPQPEIWVYQPYYYQPYYGGRASYGLGGYQPPRTGSYNPQPFFLFGFR